jgi:hypothetical protein
MPAIVAAWLAALPGAPRVPLARTCLLPAFEHGQGVGLARVPLVAHEHLPHQARPGLFGGPQ